MEFYVNQVQSLPDPPCHATYALGDRLHFETLDFYSVSLLEHRQLLRK